MSILTRGTDFATGNQVTAANLNALVDSATFQSTAADNDSTIVSGGKIIVKDLGIKTGKLENSTGTSDGVTTAKIATNAVTLAKMATQADQTVLGNVSGGTAVPTAVPIVGAAGILINSDSLGTDDTKGATQGNIKAYVELFKPNIVQDTDTTPRTFDGSSSTDFLDTQLSVSITPKFSNSKFLITCSVSSSSTNADYPPYFRVLRDGSVVTGSISTSTVGSSLVKMMFGGGAGNTNQVSSTASFNFLDGVASGGTSAITYKLQIAARQGQEVFMNRARTNTNDESQASGISSLIIQEIYQ
jgi:hypothetical protein